jgi:RNA polymerase-binding transcription factor DksA
MLMSAVQTKSLEQFARRALLERRSSLLALRRKTAEEAQQLYDEREPDWEDRAANVSAARGLEQLEQNERAELLIIQRALARLAEGSWGWCLACGRPISEARLRAIPEALRCAGCANPR